MTLFETSFEISPGEQNEEPENAYGLALRLAAIIALRFFIRSIVITQHSRRKRKSTTPMTIPATFPILLLGTDDPLLSCTDGLASKLVVWLVGISGGKDEASVVGVEAIELVGAADVVVSAGIPSDEVVAPAEFSLSEPIEEVGPPSSEAVPVWNCLVSEDTVGII